MRVLHQKKRRVSGVRAYKSFDEALEQDLRDINSISRRTKKSSEWDLHKNFDVESNKTNFKWYFCTTCYTKN